MRFRLEPYELDAYDLPMLRSAVAFAVLAAGCSHRPSMPAPANFMAVFYSHGAVLRWDAVPGLSGYVVLVTRPDGNVESYSTTETQFGLKWSTASGLFFAVQGACPADADCALTDSLQQPDKIPKITVKATGVDADVEWDPIYKTAFVAHADTPDGISDFRQAVGHGHLDTHLTPDHTYYWAAVFGAPPTLLVSDVVSETLAPSPPALSVSYAPGRSTVSWKGLTRGLWSVRLSDPGPSKPALVDQSEDSIDASCHGAAYCTISVAARSPTGAVGTYAALQVGGVPDPPATPLVHPFSDRVVLDFGSLPPFATELTVMRTDATGSDVAATSYSPLVTVWAPPWVWYTYSAFATTYYGAMSLESSPVVAAAIGAPESMNLEDDQDLSAHTQGEQITIGEGGLLELEVGAAPTAQELSVRVSSGGFLLGEGRAQVTAASSALVADKVKGTVFALGTPVSAGQVVQFEVSAVDGFTPVAAGIANAPGHHLLEGSEDASRDLVYKAFVAPAPPSTTLALIGSYAGANAVRLGWRAIPSAVRYDIERQEPDGSFTLVGSTQQSWYVANGLDPATTYVYRISAASSTGAVIDAKLMPVMTSADRGTAENLGDTAAVTYVPLCASHAVAQTFTAENAGVLSRLELLVQGPQPSLQADVFDSAGGLLGTISVANLPTGLATTPLLPDVSSASFMDLSPMGIAVAAGDLLTVQLTNVSDAGCVILRSTPDTYPGGAEAIDGVPQAGSDLAFRATVR